MAFDRARDPCAGACCVAKDDGGKEMGELLGIVLSFPTAVFSVLLAGAVGYWLLAATGLIELDLFGGSESAGGGPGDVTGSAMRMGFGGVPLSLAGTAIVLLGWLSSYAIDALLLRNLPQAWPRWATGTAALLLVLGLAVPLASFVLRPLRGFFAQLQGAPLRSFIGHAGVVRSPSVDALQGWATVEDGGAGLVLQARATAPARFARGDRIVLVEYLTDQNAYRVDAATTARDA